MCQALDRVSVDLPDVQKKLIETVADGRQAPLTSTHGGSTIRVSQTMLCGLYGGARANPSSLPVPALAAASQGPVILVLVSGGCVDLSAYAHDDRIHAILFAGYAGEEALPRSQPPPPRCSVWLLVVPMRTTSLYRMCRLLSAVCPSCFCLPCLLAPPPPCSPLTTGQAGGAAIADVLFGHVSPSGETACLTAPPPPPQQPLAAVCLTGLTWLPVTVCLASLWLCVQAS